MSLLLLPNTGVIRGIVYDSENGKTCHQVQILKCRQKTGVFSATCKNLKSGKRCTISFCRKCLLNRYGENAEEVARLADSKGRGICNCSQCIFIGTSPTWGRSRQFN